ncbi:MAG: GEVED domain-containing protein [Bacteroidales bacterium]|jgi:hypothetical protein|nr:GEVED domain-containing protein [Bacteroidales bacterium]
MKKAFLLSAICLMLSTTLLFGQQATRTYLKDSMDFETASMPYHDWSVTGNYSIEYSIYAPSTGNRSLRLIPSANNPDTLKTAVYGIGQGMFARLEFSHIPMLANYTSGGKILVRYRNQSNGSWSYQVLSKGDNTTTNPTKYDRAYGLSVGASDFTDAFYAGCYSADYPLDNPSMNSTFNSYWKNEIFMVKSDVFGVTADSIQFLFVVPQTINQSYLWAGWFLDDIRVYFSPVIGQEVKVPDIKDIIYPDNYNYPNCSENLIKIKVMDVLSVVDSVTLFYQIGNNPVQDTQMVASSLPDYYEMYLPFVGFGTEFRWRLEATDANGNKVRFPYMYGQWSKFQNVRPFVSDSPLKSDARNAQNIGFLKSGSYERLTQIRYRASELIEQGYSKGVIKEIKFDVKTASSTPMQNVKIRMSSVPTDFINNLNSGSNLGYRRPIWNPDISPIYEANTLILNSTGWQRIRLNKSFIWDGVSDIVIQIFYANSSSPSNNITLNSFPSGSSTMSKTRILNGGISSNLYNNYLQVPAQQFFDDSLNYKPNIIFKFEDCIFSIDAAMSNEMSTPAKVLSNPKLYKVEAGVPTEFTAFVRNDGLSVLPSGNTKFMRRNTNGTFSPAEPFAPFSNVQPIDTLINNGDTTFYPSDSLAINSSITFPNEGYYYMKLWTELLPANIDYNQRNDTAYRIVYPNSSSVVDFEVVSCNGPMTGTYAISPSSTSSITNTHKTFKSFEEAFRMLRVCGVGSPVTINVDVLSGTQYYTDSLRFPVNIEGASAINTITFKGPYANPTRMKTDGMVNESYNLDSCRYIIFENLAFQPADSYTSGGSKSVFKMTANTSDITFKKCRFENIAGYTTKPTALINIGPAGNITMDSCTFKYPAENAILITGISNDELTSNINISHCVFENGQNYKMTNSAIYAKYTSDLNIKNNNFSTTTQLDSNISVAYTLRIENSKKFNVQKNEFYLQNVSAIAASDIIDDPNTASQISNNTIGIYNNNSDTSSATTIYGINFIFGANTLIAHNNIWAKDNLLDGFPAVGLKIGETAKNVSNLRLMNNVIVSDGGSTDNGSITGCAVQLKTEPSATYTFKNNMYYKMNPPATDPPVANNSDLLFRNGTFMPTISEWIIATQEDSSYYTTNPYFGDWNALTTTYSFLINKGIDLLSEVPDDKSDNLRDATPCIGAYEYDSLAIDINMIEAYIADKGIYENINDTNTWTACDYTANDHITVKYINIGTDTIQSGLVLKFQVATNGGAYSSVQQKVVNHPILPYVQYTDTFTQSVNLASQVGQTKTSVIKAFSSSSQDAFAANDTTIVKIVAKGQDAMPVNKTINVPYGYTGLLTANEYTDSIYWFLNATDMDYILKSHSYQTDILYEDTIFYFSKKSEHPNVKITEIQITSSGVNMEGLTIPYPYELNEINNAFEISNLGNGPIDLENYKFQAVYGANDTLTNNFSRKYTFPSYVLPSNSSVVLVPVATTTEMNNGFLPIGTGWGITAANKSGFVLRDADSIIIDAVTINGGVFNANTNVPANIWTSGTLSIAGSDSTATLAGITRINTVAPNSTAWRCATDSTRMTLGIYDTTLTTTFDNGCYGYKASYSVNITSVPATDPNLIAVEVIGISGDTICNLGNEQIQVTLKNTGTNILNDTIPIICNLYDGTVLSQTISDTYSNASGLSSGESVNYTLANTLDLSANAGTKNYRIEAFVSYPGDIYHNNDTSSVNIVSRYTPLLPLVTPSITIPYDTSIVLTATSPDNNYIAWYNNQYETTPIAISDSLLIRIYENDTFYVSAIAKDVSNFIIGDGTAANNTSGYPSPLNSNTKKVKEQYLIKASELEDAGLENNLISSIAFDIMTTTNTNNASQTYSIKIGHTTVDDSISTWITTGLQDVYDSTIIIPNGTTGWQEFNFATPFEYDGTSNIVVQVCITATLNYPKIRTYYTQTPFKSVMTYQNNNTDACTYTSSNGTSKSANRPNMKFGVEKPIGCETERVSIVVEPLPIPYCDAAIVDISTPVDQHVQSNIPTDIEIVLKNYGTSQLTSANINWSLDGVAQPPIAWTGNLANGQSEVVLLGQAAFIQGSRSEFKTWLDNTGLCDTIQSNDTLVRDFIACYGNPTNETYLTIGTSGTEDFSSFESAIAALDSSGVCGNVIFNVSDGTYTENVLISAIRGTSSNDYILFRGATGVKPTLTSLSGAVLKLKGTNNIRFSNMIITNPSATNGNAIEILNSDSIIFSDVTINTPYTKITNLVNIRSASSNLEFDNVEFNAGSNAIYSNLAGTAILNNLTVGNSSFSNFSDKAIDLNNFNGTYIHHNNFSTIDTNATGAILLRSGEGTINISANKINLVGRGNVSTVKTALAMKALTAVGINPIYVFNNAISILGDMKGTANPAHIGIDLDSVVNLNLFYNTVRLLPGKNATNSKTISVGAGEKIKIQNNNFDNAGKGYVYYVKSPGSQVSFSNYNNYRGTSTSSNNKFAYWRAEIKTLDTLRLANKMDANSDTMYNPFVADTVLSMYYSTSISRKATVVSLVGTDINDSLRNYVNPSIGAYEYQFEDKDWGIASAYPDRGIVFPYTDSMYVEHDSISLYSDEHGNPISMKPKIRIGNFGDNSISSGIITVEVSYSPNFESDSICYTYTDTCTTTLTSTQTLEYTLNSALNLPLPLIHTLKNSSSTVMQQPLYMRAFTQSVNGSNIDTVHINDTTLRPKALTTLYSDTTKLYISPAYDIKTGDIVTTGHIGKKCDLRADTVRVKIKNMGHYTLTAANTANWTMTYQVEGRDPVTEVVNWNNFDSVTGSSIDSTKEAIYRFSTLVNLYPQNYDTVNVCDSADVYGASYGQLYRDTIYNLRVWSDLPLDNISENDTSGHIYRNTGYNDTTFTWTKITSFADPLPPHAHNDIIYFGTYGHPWADHILYKPSANYNPDSIGHLSIHWYSDSTNEASEYNQARTNRGYIPSQRDTTIRLYHDTTVYLMVKRTDVSPGCTSAYTPISVILRSRDSDSVSLYYDLSMEQIIEPYYVDTNGSGSKSWVYMTQHDTIKVRLANYGNTTFNGDQNSKLWYSIKTGTGSNATEITKGEAIFSGSIPPFTVGGTDADNYVTFAFPYKYPYTSEEDSISDMSFDFSDPNKTYIIKTWLNVPGDIAAANDTLADSVGRTNAFAKIKPRNGDNYYSNATATNANSLDISRVRLGTLNNYSVPIGNKYSNYTKTSDTALLYKGVDDSLYVTVSLSNNMVEDRLTDTIHASVKAYIDWNRDGVFTANEVVLGKNSEISHSVAIKEGKDTIIAAKIKPFLNSDTSIINGYTRMRILLWDGKKDLNDPSLNPDSVFADGEVEDYLVQIRSIDSTNAALYGFVKPDEFNTEGKIDFLQINVRNVGIQPLPERTNINWSNDGGLSWQNYQLSDLDLAKLSATGSWATISVAEDIIIDTGVTQFMAYITAPGDISHKNDTIVLNSILSPQPTLPYATNFDTTGINDRGFYAYEPNYKYPSNCWAIGNPINKNIIKQAYSPLNCVVTNLNGPYPSNNLSILYTPNFNISTVKQDTLSFWIRRRLKSGNNNLRIEYKPYNSNVWRVLGAKDDGYGINWYNNISGFNTNKDWEQASYSLKHLTDEGKVYGNYLQLRFIFSSSSTANTTEDGFAIDDFSFGRALAPVDAQAVAVKVEPTIPNYGEAITPYVVVRNNGMTPLTNFMIHYSSPDLIDASGNPYMERTREIVDTMGIAIQPGDTMGFMMPTAIVGANTPPRFTIVARAYNMNEPASYRDNDTARLLVTIAPLLTDVGVKEIIYPQGVVSVNENVEVRVKVRNYGVVMQNIIPIAYQLSNSDAIYRDTILINVPLSYGEEYTHTFQPRFQANFGTVNLKVWTALEGDMYAENDTMIHRVASLVGAKDLVADVVMIDDNDPATIGVQLNFINRSTLPVKNIKVGYFTNGNPSSVVIENYRFDSILGGSMGYHVFSNRLPRQFYSSICGFVHVNGDEDMSNDTTCNRYYGYSDASADSIIIEEQSGNTCRLSIVTTNCGTIGYLNKQVKYHVALNGEEVCTESHTLPHDVPGSVTGQILTYQIPRSADRTYDIKAWIEYPNDVNAQNDTTTRYSIVYQIGLDDVNADDARFILEQNVPNPMDKQTEIGFVLPNEGNVVFHIANNEGKVVFSREQSYSAGRHTLKLTDITLPQGVYYYTMEFEGAKLTRKMLIAR